jgi:hypothetical protein
MKARVDSLDRTARTGYPGKDGQKRTTMMARSG